MTNIYTYPTLILVWSHWSTSLIFFALDSSVAAAALKKFRRHTPDIFLS